MVGDGEAETGPLATSWHGNKFLNPASDGAVLPLLHLNGFKIANPTVLARIGKPELEELLSGYGWKPHFVEGSEPDAMHEAMAQTLDTVLEEIRGIQRAARASKSAARPRWPMIVLRSPKGWTGPKEVDGKKMEGSWRSHQVPVTDLAEHRAHQDPRAMDEELPARGALRLLRRSPVPSLRALAPAGIRRMSARTPTPTAARCCKTCACPTFASTRSRSRPPARPWARLPG